MIQDEIKNCVHLRRKKKKIKGKKEKKKAEYKSV